MAGEAQRTQRSAKLVRHDRQNLIRQLRRVDMVINGRKVVEKNDGCLPKGTFDHFIHHRCVMRAGNASRRLKGNWVC